MGDWTDEMVRKVWNKAKCCGAKNEKKRFSKRSVRSLDKI